MSTYQYRRQLTITAGILARKRCGLSVRGLVIALKFDPTGRYREKVIKGWDMPFDKFLALCNLAGIPRGWAAVLWAKGCIPDEHAELRRFVGCTMRYPRRRDWFPRGNRKPSKNNDEESLQGMREFLKEHSKGDSHECPDDIREYMNLSGKV